MHTKTKGVNGTLIVGCESCNNWSTLSYTPDEIDSVAIFDSANKNVYFIPVNRINKRRLNLRLDPAKNKQERKTHNAKDYLDFNFDPNNLVKEELREYVTG